MSYVLQTTPPPPTTISAYVSTTLATLLPGSGTVEPISTAPLPTPADTFGLSTQLIIWGMVGFILFELIAISCLLRYCCRARYLRRRKIKEKEIILADLPVATSYHINRASNYTNLDSSQMNLISTSNAALDTSQLNSLRPVLYSGGDYSQHNETIMVDDILSNYSAVNTGGHHKKSSGLSAAERMRQELSSEDIYTLRFSQSAPLEPFDTTAPVKQHQSFMYNGGVNRPAFEIVSHADVRPATPVKFENVASLVAHSDDEFLYAERDETRMRRRHHKTRSFGRSRAHTTPIRLNYGNEEMVQSTGRPVEWQVARELRTTDWDQIRRTYANEDSDPPSFRTSSPPQGRYRHVVSQRSSKSMTNLNYPIQVECDAPEEPKVLYRNVDLSGAEQTKYTNYLLESSSPPAKSKLSSASSSRNPPQPAPDTNNHTNDPKSFHSKSGANDTSLFEQSHLTHRRDRSPGDNRPAPPHPPPLLTRTNEPNLDSLSATSDSQANTDRYTYEAPTQEIVDETEPIDDLNANVSVIDVTYQDPHSFKPDPVDQPDNAMISSLPPLPPPLQFQPANDTTNLTSVTTFHDSNNYKSNDSEIDYDEEYFRPSSVISLVNELKKNRSSVAGQGGLVREESLKSSGKASGGGGDLLSEIKSFQSGSLRPRSRLSDTPKLYEKNVELLGGAQRVDRVQETSEEEVAASGQADMY